MGPFGDCSTYAPGMPNAEYCVGDNACEPCGCSCANDECNATTTPIPGTTTPFPSEDGTLRCYAGNGKDIIQVTVDSFTAAVEPKPFHVSDSLSRLLRQCDGSTDFCVTIAAVEAVANDIEVPSGNGDGGGSGEEQPGQFEWAR